uniref:Uncharacterized protein n=1 Tax=Wuchereria bancrofti TaxID=6293 RepID=A0AAF5PHC1_WUCBA
MWKDQQRKLEIVNKVSKSTLESEIITVETYVNNLIMIMMALKHFKGTITKQNGQYQVSGPWKDSTVSLIDNYGFCLGRLKTSIKRLQTDKQILN